MFCFRSRILILVYYGNALILMLCLQLCLFCNGHFIGLVVNVLMLLDLHIGWCVRQGSILLYYFFCTYMFFSSECYLKVSSIVLAQSMLSSCLTRTHNYVFLFTVLMYFVLSVLLCFADQTVTKN